MTEIQTQIINNLKIEGFQFFKSFEIEILNNYLFNS